MDDAAGRPRPRSRLGRFGAWLFEQRPERAELPVAASRPDASEHVLAEPVASAPVASAPVESEPVAPVAPEPAAPAEPSVEPEPEPAAGTNGRRYRPRPYAGAPAKEQLPADPRPGDAFFTRAHDDDLDDEPEPAAARTPDRPPHNRRSLPRQLRSLIRLVVVVAIAVVVALLLRSYVVSPYYVPSASMEPTLHGCDGCDDDHVLVEKLTYRFHDPQRGDVVVFARPSTWHVSDKVLIKRVVAVSGDRMVIKGGHLYVNDKVIDEPYVNQECRPATTADPGSTDIRKKVYPTIPNGDVFVMGDNRCDSEDSRVFGVVPIKKIIGRAFLIVWPFSRWHSL